MRMRHALGTSVAGLIVVGVALGFGRQENSPSDGAAWQDADKPDHGVLVQEEKPKIDARRERIEAELEEIAKTPLPDDHWANEWAGRYYEGDGLGMNVTILIAPKSGVTYTWHGCMGLYDGNHGDITRVLDDGLELKLALDPAGGYRVMDTRLYFVRWGADRFLVPKSLMLEFVNNYNAGGFGRRSMFGIPRKNGTNSRSLDDVERTGRPSLPAEFAKMIIEKPMKLTITGATLVKPDKDPRSPTIDGELTFSGGSDQGVYVGMEFPIEAGRQYGTVTITAVEPTSCKGRYSGFAAHDEGLALPAVGLKLDFPGVADEGPK